MLLALLPRTPDEAGKLLNPDTPLDFAYTDASIIKGPRWRGRSLRNLDNGRHLAISILVCDNVLYVRLFDSSILLPSLAWPALPSPFHNPIKGAAAASASAPGADAGHVCRFTATALQTLQPGPQKVVRGRVEYGFS